MDDEKYCGWTNQKTWEVAVYLYSERHYTKVQHMTGAELRKYACTVMGITEPGVNFDKVAKYFEEGK
jgi:hypothetical protein